MSPARLKHFYDYLPLVKNGDGAITGIFHNGLPESLQIQKRKDFSIWRDLQ